MPQKNFFQAILFSAFAFFIFPTLAMAIGQASTPIIIENAVRGQEYEDVLSLFNSSNQEESFALNGEGEIADWLTFYKMDDLENPINELTIPANSRIQAKVRISVPQSAEMGKQSGSAVFSLLNKPKEGQVNLNPVTQQVSREITVNVNDQGILSAEAFVSLEKNTIAKNEPLKINVAYYNSGSVSNKPQIRLGIFKNDINIEDVIYPYSKDKKAIMPTQTEKMSIAWQTAGRENGKYRAEVGVVLGDEIIKEDSFAFQITNDEFNPIATASIANGLLNNKSYIWIMAAIGILLLLVFAVLVMRSRRGTKLNSN